MTTYTIHQTKRNIFIVELSAQLDKQGNLKEGYNPTFASWEAGKKFESASSDATTIAKELLQQQSATKAAERATFEGNLSDFWKDVDSRVGMDVCTPFMNRFPNDSFVAYDRGFVWSKTRKTVYLLRNHTASRNYYPAGYNAVVSFGSEL